MEQNARKLLDILGRNIKEHRRILGITQEQLAESAGLSANYVARIEIGDKTPTLDTLAKIADALGTTVSELLSDAERHDLDVTECIAGLLEGLDEDDAKYAMNQLMATVKHLKRREKGAD